MCMLVDIPPRTLCRFQSDRAKLNMPVDFSSKLFFPDA